MICIMTFTGDFGRFIIGGYVALMAVCFLAVYLLAQRQRKREEGPDSRNQHMPSEQ